jgi:cytochrome bd-type quinol oxidase subunit 2
MSAPRSRKLRHQSTPVTHTRREITIAAAGSAVIVLITAVIIWAMRPGSDSDFNPGKGGIVHRQARASLWLLVTAIVVATVIWLVMRPESRVENQRRAAALSVGGVLIAAIAVFVGFHHSLVHNYATPAPATTTTTVAATTTPTTGTSTTTAAGASTSTPATTAPATTAPATTTPATTAPATTAAPATTTTG